MASASSVNSLPAIGDHRELAALARRARSCTLHAFQHEARAAGVDGRVQHRAVDERDAFLERFGDFLALRRHLRRAFQREDRDLVARAPRAARDVDRGAAAADHDHAPRRARAAAPAFACAR